MRLKVVEETFQITHVLFQAGFIVAGAEVIFLTEVELT
jgi:hypothetical protein